MIFGMNKFKFEEAGQEEGAGAPAQEGIIGDKPEEPGIKDEPTGVVKEGWLEGVENEWAQDSSMQNIKSVADLAKGYVHAQRLVGKDKVVLPSEHATPEERREFFQKLGLPENTDGYGISHSEDSVLSEDAMKDFVAKAHEAGVMPDAAKSMLAWHEEREVAKLEAANKQYEEQVATTITELKQEYGQAYETKLTLANTVIDKLVPEEQANAMRESGLFNDKNFIKTMVGIAEAMSSEAGFDVNPQADGRLTPSEAQRRINDIQADFGHAYHNKAHPNHENAVKEMTDLWKQVG